MKKILFFCLLVVLSISFVSEVNSLDCTGVPTPYYCGCAVIGDSPKKCYASHASCGNSNQGVCKRCEPVDCCKNSHCSSGICNNNVCTGGGSSGVTSCPPDTPCGIYPDCIAKTTFYLDADTDTYGDINTAVDACVAPVGGYVNNSHDCDDSNDDVYPGAPEICDSQDNQCPGDNGYGQIDEGCSYCGDGFVQNPNDYGETEICDGNSETRECGSDVGECELGDQTRYCNNDCTWDDYEDCNDIRPSEEICDGLDNDCDGDTLQEIRADESELCFIEYSCDFDEDGYIKEELTGQCDYFECLNDVKENIKAGSVIDCEDQEKIDPNLERDCDDDVYEINPSVQEICIDGIDNDCSGQADDTCNCNEGDIIDCTKNGGVCSDYKLTCGADGVMPRCNWYSLEEKGYEKVEITCDTLDNDCDGRIDEGCDNDKDSYMDFNMKCNGEFFDGNGIKRSCSDYTDDCDDSSLSKFPGNTEVCDGKDNDCNNNVDDIAEENYKFCKEIVEGYRNVGVCEDKKAICDYKRYQGWFCLMGDFFTPNEICDDNLDNNCDGIVDDTCPCDPGDEQNCGSDTGECSVGNQICNSQGVWGQCLNSISPTNEQCDNLDNDCDGLTDEDLSKECSLDGCNGEQECSEGEWQSCIAVCTNIIGVDITSEDMGDFVIDGKLTQEDVKKALNTLDTVNQTLSYQYVDGYTELTNILNPENELDDVSYALNIPKCLTEYIDKLDFENKNYVIVQEDPLIAWHFTEVDERIELGYKVQGKIPEECLAQIKSLPVAQVIGPKLGEEKSSFKTFIVPVVILFIVGVATVSLNKFRPKEEKPVYTHENIIEKQREKMLKEIKAMKFNSKEQSNNYMKERGYSEDTINWILEKL